jgi:hypothetical protein
MAYNPLTNAQIEVGEPVQKELINKIEGNESDFDSRLAALEAAGSIFEVFNCHVVNLGQYSSGGNTGIILIKPLPFNMNLIEARIYVIKAGTSGTIEMDVQVGSAPSSLSSVMSVRPSLSAGAGDEVFSTNQVFSSTAVSEGDFIGVEFNQIQTGIGAIVIQVLGEPA